LYMPGIPTSELLARAQHLHPQTPCIIITAEDNEESMRAMFALGASAYLTKPLRPAMLRDILLKKTAG